MRERPCYSFGRQVLTGITPARAGKTLRIYFLPRNSRDHPRSCGKDCLPPSVRYSKEGSPPLVRERQTYTYPKPFLARITPARAGKTPCDSFPIFTNQDHPRSCGKDIPNIEQSFSALGSPPLVRERRNDKLLAAMEKRITPARAGKTVQP